MPFDQKDVDEAYKRWPDQPGDCTMSLKTYYGNIRYAFIAGIRYQKEKK